MSSLVALNGVNQQVDQQSIQKGVNGAALVTQWSNTAAYVYAGRVLVAAQTVAAGGYDVINIQGSSVTITDSVNGAIQQRTAKIKSAVISAESTLASALPMSVIRRTTANSGGTKSQLGAAPHDVNDMSAQNSGLNITPSVVFNVYTAIPTVGAAFGASSTPTGNGILGQQVVVATNAGAIAQAATQWINKTKGVKPWVLRGASDFISLSIAVGTVIPVGGVTIDYEFVIEEDYSTIGG